MASASTESIDHLYDEVYGKTFALYTRSDIETFIAPFHVRFQNNGISPAEIFSGTNCLDAASGSGRGAIFMLASGARTVTAVDISDRNVKTTIRNVELFGGKVDARLENLSALPFPDESFDVVWCNGAIMHTEHPDRCMHEVARVLKTGGWLWLYVYGGGGVYWFIIETLRKRMQKNTAGELVAALRLLSYPVDRVAEFLDDWKVPYLRTYVRRDVEMCLQRLGFGHPRPLEHGMSYDTNYRISANPGDAAWLGEGDLRFLARKTATTPGLGFSELDALRRSAFTYTEQVVAALEPPLTRLFDLTRVNRLAEIASAAKLQFDLRETLREPGPFSIDRLVGVVAAVTNLARTAGVVQETALHQANSVSHRDH